MTLGDMPQFLRASEATKPLTAVTAAAFFPNRTDEGAEHAEKIVCLLGHAAGDVSEMCGEDIGGCQ
jgi:hypothetical protein